MKKIIFILAVINLSLPLTAKKVMFRVDLRNEIVNANGVHVTGDFQTIAGFAGGDWNPATIAMTQEIADTNIYSVVVDIPAFAKYEFKFVNGIFGYETEFVPLESRVQYNFVDNRWIWIDSLANDTTVLAPVLFGGNAPAAKFLVRLKVDMQNETVNAAGAHVAGFFNGFNAPENYMYTFDGDVHEIISYVDTGTLSTVYEYQYYNGSAPETVPAACVTTNGRRGSTILKDTVMDPVCYGQCVSCAMVGVNELSPGTINLFPNPAISVLNINSEVVIDKIMIRDLSGRTVYSAGVSDQSFSFQPALGSGVYFIECYAGGKSFMQKIIIE